VGYDFDPQYQRQPPHDGSVGADISGSAGAHISGAVGAATDGVVDAAAVGTVPLPLIENTSTQIRGSTASIFLVMVNLL
jgi:hypothetical protein